MPNRSFPMPGFRSPTAVSAPVSPCPYTHHLHLDDSGYARWDVRTDDMIISRIACMGEESEKDVELLVSGRVVGEFSSLHLSLLWPDTFTPAPAILVDRRESVEVRGPIRAIVLLVGAFHRGNR